MATTTNVTTTYAGELALPYIQAALLNPSTIRNGGVTVKPNVKFKQVLKKVAMSDLIKDGTCDFTPTGTITLTENILQPEEFQVNFTLCKADFRDDWEAIAMGLSANDNLPPNLSDFIIAKTAAEVATANETIIWQGATGNAGEYDGFLARFLADATVVDVVGTTVTAANVIEELGKVVDAIPAALYGKEDLFIYVPQNVYRAYTRALGGFGASGLGANGFEGRGTNQALGDLVFDGVKIFLAEGLPSNEIVAAQASNLFFGTSLLSDLNEVKILDMSDLDGSQNCRFVMRYTAGVNYAYGAEVVYYS
ncbi:MAG: hypothetical protein HQ473_07410 [Cryomorphaceae bacterium]|nr:hypothetical protein [Cryomorphaceae bacterium]